MEINFKVAKYKNTEADFILTGYDEYRINFIESRKKYRLFIVVNNILTPFEVNFKSAKTRHKSNILKAIHHYINNIKTDEVLDVLTIEYLETKYPQDKINNIKNHILGINKEDKRDRLTYYNLI
jgi:hypothetical protein